MDIHSVIRKCDNTYGFWGGYLQPMEIIILSESGLINHDQDWKLKDAKACKKVGKCRPTWFYFQPKPKFLELHRGLKR